MGSRITAAAVEIVFSSATTVPELVEGQCDSPTSQLFNDFGHKSFFRRSDNEQISSAC
jgi:hypothetical protein